MDKERAVAAVQQATHMAEAKKIPHAILLNTVKKNLGTLGSCQELAAQALDRGFKIICFMHDDVNLLEWRWDRKLYRAFWDLPKAGLIGLGGAQGLGHPDIYQKPYELDDLVRHRFASNMSDAEVHGDRIHKRQRSAVLDGFFMAFRAECLKDVEAFNWDLPGPHHCYDTVACLEAIRAGWQVWTLPLACRHLGGRTALDPRYTAWLKRKKKTDQDFHRLNHQWVYENYRDVLPIWV